MNGWVAVGIVLVVVGSGCAGKDVRLGPIPTAGPGGVPLMPTFLESPFKVPCHALDDNGILIDRGCKGMLDDDFKGWLLWSKEVCLGLFCT